jgi:hypothetical protein
VVIILKKWGGMKYEKWELIKMRKSQLEGEEEDVGLHVLTVPGKIIRFGAHIPD